MAWGNETGKKGPRRFSHKFVYFGEFHLLAFLVLFINQGRLRRLVGSVLQVNILDPDQGIGKVTAAPTGAVDPAGDWLVDLRTLGERKKKLKKERKK